MRNLAGRVIDDPFVLTLLVVVTEPAGEHAGVVGARIDAGAERRQIFAVVELADDQRTIDITVDEIDEHFGADARHEVAAPVRAGEPLGDAYPGARSLIAGRIACAVAWAGVVEAAGVGSLAALPVVLDLDAVVALGAHHRIGQPDDARALHRCFWARVGFRHDWGGEQYGGEAIAVAPRLDVAGLEQLRCLGAKIVGAVMFDVQRTKTRTFAAIAVVLRQCESDAFAQHAHAAGAVETLHRRFEPGQRQIGTQLGGGRVFEHVGAAAVEYFHDRKVAIVEGAGDLRPRGFQRLVVPTAAAHRIGLHLTVFAEHLHAVISFRGVGAVKAYPWLTAFERFSGTVEQDERVSAVGGVVAGHGRLVMLETIRQAFLGEQASDEAEFGLTILRDAAVCAQRLGDFTAPVGDVVGAENRVEHTKHIDVLELQAVLTLRGERQPRLDDKPVARQPAIGAQAHCRGHIAVPVAVSPVGEQQTQGDFFAQQALEFEDVHCRRDSRFRSGKAC